VAASVLRRRTEALPVRGDNCRELWILSAVFPAHRYIHCGAKADPLLNWLGKSHDTCVWEGAIFLDFATRWQVSGQHPSPSEVV
jgi:hypothetical protein